MNVTIEIVKQPSIHEGPNAHVKLKRILNETTSWKFFTKMASKLVTHTIPKRCRIRLGLVTMVLLSLPSIQLSQAITAGYTAMGNDKKQTRERPIALIIYQIVVGGIFKRMLLARPPILNPIMKSYLHCRSRRPRKRR